MDKYSVKTNEDLIKIAGKGKRTCPICGKPLMSNSNVPKCPVHGTKPFEPGENYDKTKEKIK